MYNLQDQCPFIYNEIFVDNHYRVYPREIKNQHVIDCGAHFGFFSIVSLVYGAKLVDCVEMNQQNVKTLQGNLSTVFPKSLFQIHPLALYPNNGQKIVTYHKESFLSEINKENAGLEVGVVNLEDLITEDCVVKMDIEGTEHEILYSLPKEKLGQIRRLYIEIHGDKEKRLALRRFLCDSGFIEEYVNQLFVDGAEGETEINKYVKR